MQITDLLVPERVALNMQVADKAMAIHAMVGMLDRTGCLRDAGEYYILKRFKRQISAQCKVFC